MSNDLKVFDERKRVEHKIIRLYEYGSHVYGTATKDSDKDYIAVVESNEDLLYSVRNEYCDYTVYSKSMFIKAIQEHKASVLECIFQHEDDEYRKYFQLDTEKLRREFSAISSNSYVKCKKKIKDGEEMIGLKSLFHSLRILAFGIQIAIEGRISNYSIANPYFDYILEIGADWDKLNEKFKPIFNNLKSNFKKYAPLNIEKERLTIDELIGKKAYRKSGFFSGILGIIEKSDSDFTNYKLVYPDGSANAFNNIHEIELID